MSDNSGSYGQYAILAGSKNLCQTMNLYKIGNKNCSEDTHNTTRAYLKMIKSLSPALDWLSDDVGSVPYEMQHLT